MTTTDPTPAADGRVAAARTPASGSGRGGRRRRPHPASVARVLVAGVSASATLLLVAGFAGGDARSAGPAEPPSYGRLPAVQAEAPAVTGWDGGGATAAPPSAYSSPADHYTPPDTQSEAS